MIAEHSWPDEEPPLTTAFRRWFFSRIRQHIAELDVRRRLFDGPELPEEVAAWYDRNPTRWVRWVSEKTYARGFRNGAWHLDENAIAEVWEYAMEEALRELTERAHADLRSVEDWLAAERVGRLPAWVAFEPAGFPLVREDRQGEFREARQRMTETWPMRCSQCGSDFRPERRGVVRCPECRSAHKGVRRKQRREE